MKQIDDEIVIHDYVKQCVDNGFVDLRDKFDRLELSMTARIAVLEEAISAIGLEMQAFQQQSAKFSLGQSLNLEKVFLKIETLIAGLLTDLKLSSEELSAWRSKFTYLGLHEAGRFVQTGSLPKKMTNLENRLLAIEQQQRQLNSQHYSSALHGRIHEDRDSLRIKERQQLNEKVAELAEHVKEHTKRFNRFQQRSVSGDVLARAQSKLVANLQAERSTLKENLKSTGSKITKTCRHLNDGLLDVSGTTEQMAHRVGQVHAAIMRQTGPILAQQYVP